jgi:molybdopterin converting factor small subunit
VSISTAAVMPMPTLKLLGGLRRFTRVAPTSADSVRALLDESALPRDLLFPEGELNRDIEVLVNGRNIAFLDGLDTTLADSDRVTVFLHGARGYPGG